MTGVVYQFGDFTLDAGRFAISRHGRPLSIERKPLELLILLVERDGQLVTRAEIAERLWDREVFVDTEHGINTAIRKIRYALRDDPDQPQFVQTVQGKGYRFIAPLTVQTAPPPAPLSATEIPAVSAPSPSIPGTGAPPAQPRSRALWAVASALLLAFAGIFLVRAWQQHATAATLHSLAVLPLDNLSGDPAQDYFADGITDELTAMLAKDSTLRIVSRTSVMQYKRAHRPLPDIARALHVDGIVEGSVARSGQQIHMTLQLIQASTDSHLWAESYDRESDDDALPDDAARAIATRLHSVAPSLSAVRYVNPAAHDAFLRGRYLWPTDRMLESGEYFRKAAQIQPDYAEAWAWLSNYYGEGVAGDLLDPRTNLQLEWNTAQRAIQLDPNLADAHEALGAAFFIARWDWADADREILRSISLDPQNGETWYLRACLLNALNRFDEAIAVEKKSMELDPYEHPGAMADILSGGRRFQAALSDLRLRLEVSPNNPDLLYGVYDIQRRMGDTRAAVDSLARWHILTGDPQSAARLRRAYQQGGERGFIHWQLDRRLAKSKSNYVSPGELATWYALLGDKEKALDLLEESWRWHTIDAMWIETEPAFDFLHADPRFQALVQKTGLPPLH